MGTVGHPSEILGYVWNEIHERLKGDLFLIFEARDGGRRS